ncbi:MULTISPECIES: tyrosine-type recombinase/integrase [unclassified Nocardia]|uniref:site-specific integrase n=1 Tax=unclassified Nocardia TaxID=2637762 RepID=UPI001CE3C2D0|nr:MULTISPECIES: tyrosine-type recombinase/integrase [unclassified Nocardia]
MRAAAAVLAPDTGGELTTSTTVVQLWQSYREYLVKMGRAEGTLRLYDRWAEMLIAECGYRRIVPEEFKTSTAEAFLEVVAENHGRGSMLNARSMMSGMFRYAVRKGPLDVNPVREAEIPQNVTPRGRTGGAASIEVEDLRFILASVYWSTVPCPRKLTKAEQRRGIRSYTPPTVAEYCEDADLADLIAIMSAIGQRPSQVLGLAWPFYNSKKKTIQTVGKVIRVKGKGLVRVIKDNDPKNPQGTIALPDYAVEILDRRWEKLQERKRENPPPDKYDPQLACHPADLIFPSFEWTLRDPVNVNHQWQRVREALGLPDDLSPYALRKLVALVLDDLGLSARVIADILQHADPAMTQRKYMARGKVHHHAAAAMHRAVLGPDNADDEDHDGNGRARTFVRLSCDFPGLNTNSAPDRAS